MPMPVVTPARIQGEGTAAKDVEGAEGPAVPPHRQLVSVAVCPRPPLRKRRRFASVLMRRLMRRPGPQEFAEHHRQVLVRRGRLLVVAVPPPDLAGMRALSIYDEVTHARAAAHLSAV